MMRPPNQNRQARGFVELQGRDRRAAAVMADDAQHAPVVRQRARGGGAAIGRAAIVLDAQGKAAAERLLDGRQSPFADFRDAARERRREADDRPVSGY